MRGFVLNHESTSASLGLRLAGVVKVPVAQRVVEDIEVAGRAGTLTRRGGWHDVSLTLPLAVDTSQGLAVFRNAVLAFGQTTTISLEEGSFRKVKHVTLSPLRRELTSWGLFEAEVVCAPFTYLDTGQEIETLAASGSITNPGLLEAAPVITVYGTGVLSFSINNRPYRVKSPAGQVTLDSGKLTAHVSDRVQADALIGDFPALLPGRNTVTLGTGISRVEVVGNWRNP